MFCRVAAPLEEWMRCHPSRRMRAPFSPQARRCAGAHIQTWFCYNFDQWMRGGRQTQKNFKKPGPGRMADTPRAGTGDFACRSWRYRCSIVLMARAIFSWVTISWSDRPLPLIIVDNSHNMQNTGFFPDYHLLSVTDRSMWLPYSDEHFEFISSLIISGTATGGVERALNWRWKLNLRRNVSSITIWVDWESEDRAKKSIYQRFSFELTASHGHSMFWVQEYRKCYNYWRGEINNSRLHRHSK